MHAYNENLIDMYMEMVKMMALKNTIRRSNLQSTIIESIALSIKFILKVDNFNKEIQIQREKKFKPKFSFMNYLMSMKLRYAQILKEIKNKMRYVYMAL